MLVMALLTNVVSNNAAGVIGTPIAIQVARELGVSPEPFVLAVIFGANMSYATPFGYQTNLLLLSAGGYRFSDFMRVGVPLTWVGANIYLSDQGLGVSELVGSVFLGFGITGLCAGLAMVTVGPSPGE